MEKCKRIAMLAIFILLFIAGNSQEQNEKIGLVNIKPQALEIGYNKTSNIIFPSKIVSVDRGDQSIILQKAKGAENILQLKAAKKRFQETNLTVVTADGKFYSFLVNYSDAPEMLNVSVREEPLKQPRSILLAGDRNMPVLENERNQVATQRSFLKIRRTNQKISLDLVGIYLGEQSMWFSIELKNNSFIDYKPTQLRFFIKDKHRSKRTAIQEQEIFPSYSNELTALNGLDKKSFAVAFAPFTISSTKRLVIAINEEGGSRELILRVKHTKLIKARPIVH